MDAIVLPYSVLITSCRSYFHSRRCPRRYTGRYREGFELFLHPGVSQAIGVFLTLLMHLSVLRRWG